MLVSPDTHTIIQNDKHDEEKVVFDFGARSSYQDASFIHSNLSYFHKFSLKFN